MDSRSAAVDGRIDDLRRLSAELHLAREAARPKPSGTNRLRVALGRWLVKFGGSLIGDIDGGAPAVARR